MWDGIKTNIIGRLNVTRVTHHEWAIDGSGPLNSIGDDINYARARAKTLYGILGIKVWVCKGEKKC